MSVYKCPVCHGKGIVPAGFYDINPLVVGGTSTNTSAETCKSCNGTGVIQDYIGIYYGGGLKPPFIPECKGDT